jgi:hypothetical protein
VGFLASGVVQLPIAFRLPEDQIAGRVGLLLVTPLFFGVGCYLFGLIVFSVYNLIAKRFGGIEIEIDDRSEG